MTTGIQILMGVSLGACSGLRACLPLLILGLMARFGYVPVNPAFALLTHTDTLVVLALASALEFLGDKIIVIDHFLDAIGTVARPVAGTILASATLTHVDTKTALLLGLMAGGTSALSVHAGKAVTRAKATVLAPLHGGTGNVGLSLLEDGVVVAGLWLAVHAPVLAFVLSLLLIASALCMVYLAVKTGKKVFTFFKTRRLTAQT